MDIVKDLVETVKSELSVIDSEHSNDFFIWMKDEYINFTLLHRTDCLITLELIEQGYPEYAPFTKILIKHLDSYGSLQAYFRASLDLIK